MPLADGLDFWSIDFGDRGPQFPGVETVINERAGVDGLDAGDIGIRGEPGSILLEAHFADKSSLIVSRRDQALRKGRLITLTDDLGTVYEDLLILRVRITKEEFFGTGIGGQLSDGSDGYRQLSIWEAVFPGSSA